MVSQIRHAGIMLLYMASKLVSNDITDSHFTVGNATSGNQKAGSFF